MSIPLRIGSLKCLIDTSLLRDMSHIRSLGVLTRLSSQNSEINLYTVFLTS
eukprot:GABW01002939.1.p2 GENE.GABW01002939.1~~GABW01002939.1.p2  ORF type:complete len:51 (+),score=2.85 GABW01002939.1:217-369(+)